MTKRLLLSILNWGVFYEDAGEQLRQVGVSGRI
jgi:hypothetical protein